MVMRQRWGCTSCSRRKASHKQHEHVTHMPDINIQPMHTDAPKSPFQYSQTYDASCTSNCRAPHGKGWHNYNMDVIA